MKKQIMIICMILLSLSACQPTPKEAAVVDKSEGLSKEHIISVDYNTPKDLNVPEHWKETITRSGDYMTLKADYDIELAEIYNTPVYSYKAAPLSEERLEELCNYFSEGNKLYKVPEMTKQELIAEKEKLEKRVGRWSRYLPDFSSTAVANEKLERFDVAIENAPEEKTEREYVTVSFTAPHQTEEEFVRDWGMRTIYNYYYETDRKIAFEARVEKGQEVDPRIRVINYDKKVGSSTHFLYKQGKWIDEVELVEQVENFEHRAKTLKEYLAPLKEIMKKEVKGYTKEDAIAEVEKIVKDLSIKDMEIYSCVKAIGIPDSESWAGFDEVDKIKDGAYAVTLYPKCGELYGITMRRDTFEDLAGNVYMPPYYTQKLYIVLTQEEIQKFEWTDISERTEVVAENTKLLPFEEIKEKLADHLLYRTVADYGENSKEQGYKTIFEVIDIELRATNINAFESISSAWFIPVWVIELDETMVSPPDGSLWPLNGTETIVINAIDGGFVSNKL